jgi:four helix bundle protein
VISGQWPVIRKERRRMIERVRSYKDLKVWQKGIELVPRVYKILRSFPKEERFAMVDQMRRSVVSVPSNIAEGQARQHRKEFLQSLYIARGSLAELDTLITVAEHLGYVNSKAKAVLDKEMIELRRMLQGLINTLQPRKQN